MLWSAVLCLALVSSVRNTPPPGNCLTNEQCTPPQYCDTSANICLMCINCDDLKRESPAYSTPQACIKSVSECGPCLKGLVLNHQSDVGAECVTRDDGSYDSAFPPYGWALIAFGIVLFVTLVIVFIVFVLRNQNSIKILASMRTSFGTNGATRTGPGPCDVMPDAPPPPYNMQYQYESVRPDSPSTYQLPSLHNIHEDNAQPFIKSAPSSFRPREQRESGDNQSAIPYNLPAYLAYDRPQSPNSVTTPEFENDNQENLFVVHDEETMQSNWTSNNNDKPANGTESSGTQEDDAEGEETVASGAAVAGGVSVAASQATGAMSLALRDALSGQPPAKKQRTNVQDSNNNGNRESNATTNEGNNPPYPSTSSNQTAVFINVQVNNK